MGKEQQDGSADRSAYHQANNLSLIPRTDIVERKKELPLVSCPLTLTFMPWHVHTHIHMHIKLPHTK